MASYGLIAEDGSREHPFNGPEATIWAVPMDDTHTIHFRLRHFRSSQPKEAQAPKMAFGQEDGTRSYDEAQRLPGDYEAQTSQRSIVVHALEHLTSSDRGIIMWRRRLRQSIQAAMRGEDPHPTLLNEGVIQTYCNDTVLSVPPLPTEGEDRKHHLELGLQLIAQYIKDHPARISC
jgi:hypothetical protein